MKILPLYDHLGDFEPSRFFTIMRSNSIFFASSSSIAIGTV